MVLPRRGLQVLLLAASSAFWLFFNIIYMFLHWAVCTPSLLTFLGCCCAQLELDKEGGGKLCNQRGVGSDPSQCVVVNSFILFPHLEKGHNEMMRVSTLHRACLGHNKHSFLSRFCFICSNLQFSIRNA